MKKSTQNTCICLIVALILGIAAVVMAYFGLLPGMLCTIEFAVKFAAAAILALFILSAFSGCQCMRKLFIALCRYGKCLIVALMGTLAFGLLLLAISLNCTTLALLLFVLFLFAMFFALAMLVLALAIYTMASAGCPAPCKRPVRPVCEDNDDFDGCKF